MRLLKGPITAVIPSSVVFRDDAFLSQLLEFKPVTLGAQRFAYSLQLRRGEDRPRVAREELQMSRFCVVLMAAMASLCGQASKYFFKFWILDFCSVLLMQSEKRRESFTEEVSHDNCTSTVELFSRGKRCVFSAM